MYMVREYECETNALRLYTKTTNDLSDYHVAGIRSSCYQPADISSTNYASLSIHASFNIMPVFILLSMCAWASFQHVSKSVFNLRIDQVCVTDIDNDQL